MTCMSVVVNSLLVGRRDEEYGGVEEAVEEESRGIEGNEEECKGEVRRIRSGVIVCEDSVSEVKVGEMMLEEGTVVVNGRVNIGNVGDKGTVG